MWNWKWYQTDWHMCYILHYHSSLMPKYEIKYVIPNWLLCVLDTALPQLPDAKMHTVNSKSNTYVKKKKSESQWKRNLSDIEWTLSQRYKLVLHACCFCFRVTRTLILFLLVISCLEIIRSVTVSSLFSVSHIFYLCLLSFKFISVLLSLIFSISCWPGLFHGMGCILL